MMRFISDETTVLNICLTRQERKISAMKRTLFIAATLVFSGYSLHGAVNTDAAFKLFWDAPPPSPAQKAGHAIVESGVDFEGAWTRLKAGRTYGREKTGLIR